ncbi:MAG: 3-methyl-2-oxobutanoate hydroxymethyltransferase [Betaproteobacteria bacterium]|nr:3-methyl-2-oxobutanoate hydroxymethyltransferase [Betaproteobacteria bacterium]
MSEAPRKKVTLNYLRQKKASGDRITSIGVYDAPMAAIADRVGFDLLIVGNAGPMSLFAHRDPTTVKYEEQLFMTQAVSRVTKYGFVVGHMPYMSYHLSKEDTIRNAGRMVSEGGADAVKCEETGIRRSTLPKSFALASPSWATSECRPPEGRSRADLASRDEARKMQ